MTLFLTSIWSVDAAGAALLDTGNDLILDAKLLL